MKQTDRTLIEQMQISDLEIQQRMALFSFTSADIASIKQCRPTIEKRMDELVDRFYKVQTSIPDIALLIGDAGTLERLRSAQRSYVTDLFSGFYDLEYVNNRLRIGLVHKRIGVEPKLYLSAVHTLKEMINDVIYEELGAEEGRPVVIAIEKLLMFDVTLVFDTYIRSLLSEIETAKQKSDIYAGVLETKVQERTRELEKLSKVDSLTGLMNVRYLIDTLVHSLRGAQRRQRLISVAYLDLDDLKVINDNEGHQRGDELLIHFAEALSRVSRGEDWCFRYGGDEFCVILPECNESEAMDICLNRLRMELEKTEPSVRFSVGVAQAGPDTYPSPEELIELADKKMYKMKQEQKAQLEDSAG